MSPARPAWVQANVSADPRLFNCSAPPRCPAALRRWPPTGQDAGRSVHHELIVGGSGAGSSLSILPTVFNHVSHQIRVIEGYKGTPMRSRHERGEVQGVCATYGQFRIYEQLLREGKLRSSCGEERNTGAQGGPVDLRNSPRPTHSASSMRFVSPASSSDDLTPCHRARPRERVEVMRQGLRRNGAATGAHRRGGQAELDMDLSIAGRSGAAGQESYETPPEMVETVKKLVPP